MVNHLRLGEELLNMKDPPIRAIYISANNPAVTCPEVHKVRRGLAREDLFTVVHDPFMTDTARFADIVLPAASYLETDDLYRAYGAYWMQWGRQAAKPQGEARSNFDVAQALAKRMGLTDAIFALSPQDAARELFKGATGPAAAADPAKLFAGEPIHIAHDWDGQPFKTPSGKLEFYSEQLARLGVSPMPDWNEDPVEVAEAAKWPLRLLTAPGYFQAHTAFSGVGFLRGREGKPFCVLHPEDAAQARPRGRRRGAPVQRPRRHRPDAAGERRDPARRRAGARPAPHRRGGVGHHQHAVLGPLHRHGRRGDLPEHLARCRAMEGAASRGRINFFLLSPAEGRERWGGGESGA